MNENLELLQLIYENVDMEVKSLTNLLNSLKEKNNKIKPLISSEIKEFEKYIKESKKMLQKYKAPIKDKGTVAKIMSKMGIQKEVKSDNSDEAIAEMVIEGFTMGNLEITRVLKNYEKICDKKIVKMAQNLIKYGQEEIGKLKEYL